MKTALSESEAETEEKPIIMLDSKYCDWLVLPLLPPTLPQSPGSFHWIMSDGVISGVGRKWERSDSSDSDSVELMTPLRTTIFDFH